MKNRVWVDLLTIGFVVVFLAIVLYLTGEGW